MYKCDICEKEFKSHRHLNGHKSVHREGGRYSISRKKKKATRCSTCKTLTFNSKYCSNKCQAEHTWRTSTIPRIEKGECSQTSTIRKYLIEKFEERCTLCGIGALWNNKPITLHVDHVDGNSDNNNVSNLRLLCPNCHSQTDTFGSKGQGNRYRKDSKRSEYNRNYRASLV